MGVAHLRFWPPPSRGQTARPGQVGRRDTDEGIDIFEDDEILLGDSPAMVSAR
jgi:hypothetical protein